MKSPTNIGIGWIAMRKNSDEIDKTIKSARIGQFMLATRTRSNLFGQTAARRAIQSRKSPPRLLSAQRFAASKELARDFNRRQLAPLNPKKIGCAPAVIALAASLQIIGSNAAWSQDTAPAHSTSEYQPDASSSGTSGGRQVPSNNARIAAAGGQDLQCPRVPCEQAGEGAVRDDPEFAQAVEQAREFIGRLTGVGQAEDPDPETGQTTETPFRRPLPPLDGSGSARAINQAHAGTRLEEGVAEGAPAAEVARPNVGFEEPEYDPITEWKAALLEESGLLSRQSEISESILLMERQIKQAELIARLMEINGPDAAIEIAPGRFKMFRDTPVGRRVAAEMAENGLNSQKRALELQVEIKRKRAELDDAPASNPVLSKREEVSAKVEQLVRAVPPPEPVLEEVFGTQGRLVAIFRIGDTRLSVIEGDALPGGARVVAINENSVLIEQNGIARTHAINR